jgi:hypothetical protein
MKQCEKTRVVFGAMTSFYKSSRYQELEFCKIMANKLVLYHRSRNSNSIFIYVLNDNLELVKEKKLRINEKDARKINSIRINPTKNFVYAVYAKETKALVLDWDFNLLHKINFSLFNNLGPINCIYPTDDEKLFFIEMYYCDGKLYLLEYDKENKTFIKKMKFKSQMTQYLSNGLFSFEKDNSIQIFDCFKKDIISKIDLKRFKSNPEKKENIFCIKGELNFIEYGRILRIKL